jgi:hypothetical protein
MEEAVLRPPRRHTRSLLGIFAVVVSIGLVWPAAIAARGSSASESASTLDARAERSPTVRGQGTKALEAGRGHGPTKPLQKVTVDDTKRLGAGAPTDAPNPDVVTPQGVTPNPVLATGSGAPAATSFGPWEGLDQAASGLEPPDPWVAVGPDDVVQTVQSKLRFTNREGASTAADLDIFEFFDLGDFEIAGSPVAIDGVSDPRWLFDVKHNRWIGSTAAWHCDDDGDIDNPSDDSLGFVFGAISTTGDPTGDYYHFYILYTGYFPHQPTIGTSGDKFTVGVTEHVLGNDATCADSIPPDAGSLTTFDWAQMLTFPALPDVGYEFDFDWFALRPAVSPQGVSNTIFVVGETVDGDDPGCVPDPSDCESNVVYMRITGTNAGAGTSLSAPRDLTNLNIVAAFRDPPPPIQPGSVFPNNTVDRRPTDAIWQDNVLTFASTYPCDPVGGGAENRDCARVTQVETSTATPTLVQDVLIGTTGKDTWYPGIGISGSGILHTVYTVSSATEGMSSFDRYQLPSDSVNTLSAPREIADGGAVAYAGSRWGNYVGLAQDPRDTNAVWQGNQYTKSNGTWGTRVSELQTAGSTFVGIAPVRLLDSRFNIGTTGPFTSSVPKSVDIAGRMGIPNDAVAITGNLTVVGQQAAGYASLTPLPNANPATSTINFPLGDNRANNITSPLSNAGGVSLTYKATPGKQTHFILDVTGYFLNDDTGQTYNVLTPLRVLDTRFDVGLTNAFPANTNRTFQVAGVGAIPATAKAITGNLTVANQTGAGFVTLATNPPPTNPATSTINFPVGDARANGVTVALSSTGKLSAVYKAPPGRTTHLILDVTGYYLDDLNGARFVALAPGRRMDTRFPAPQEGLTGAFAANASRTLIVEPYQGVPANATAITGNLTVVGQTRAGYVSMTQTATNNPATSTLNFPLGDTRANGVTGPLSGAGSVGLVFKASGGLTHLILDVTGYFR